MTRESIESLLFALSRSHDSLTRENWHSAGLRDVIRLARKCHQEKMSADWMAAASPPRHPSPRHVALAGDRPGLASKRDAPQ
jgi:hypothetical protein